MKTQLLLLMILATSISFGQALEWATGTQGKGGVETYVVDFDSEGNVYSVGDFIDTIDVDPSEEEYILGFHHDPDWGHGLDGYIQKMDENGNHLWAYRFGENQNDAFTSLMVDSEDNLYVLGYFSDTVDFDLKDGVYEHEDGYNTTCLIKYDQDANLLWTYIFEPYHSLNDITEDNEGNIYLTGQTNEGLIFIAKFSSSGLLLWSHDFGEGGPKGEAIDCDSENNVYISGTFDETIDFDPSDDEYIIEGEPFQYQAFFLKLDSDGNFIWARSVEPTEGITISDLEVDSEDNVYTVGSFKGTGDMDPSEGIHGVGTTYTNLFVHKMDMDANFQWFRYARLTSGTSKAYSICTTDEGDIYVTGIFQRELTLDTFDDDESASIESTSLSATDAYLYHLRDNGDFHSVHGFGGNGEDGANTVALNEEGDLFTCGYFQDTCNIDPFGEGYNLSRIPSSYSGYIQKINLSESVGIKENGVTSIYGVYPNPTESDVNIRFDASQVISAQLYSIDGREWYSEQGTNGFHIMNIEYVPQGFYLLIITDESGIVSTHKIIKN